MTPGSKQPAEGADGAVSTSSWGAVPSAEELADGLLEKRTQEIVVGLLGVCEDFEAAILISREVVVQDDLDPPIVVAHPDAAKEINGFAPSFTRR